MLIELTGHETGLPVFVESKKILVIGSVVNPSPVTSIKLDDVQGSYLMVNGYPHEVIHAIERQTGEVLFAKEPTGSTPVDLQRRFERILEGLEKLEEWMDDEPAVHSAHQPVFTAIRNNLKYFDPR